MDTTPPSEDGCTPSVRADSSIASLGAPLAPVVMAMCLQWGRLSSIAMEAALWYVLTGTRGGKNRIRLLQTLDERPRNANQLAEDLDLDYKTVRHHLEVLEENNIVRDSGDDYGAVYLPTEQVRVHWETVETIIDDADIGE